ncbi:MAG: hypothetical protein GY803_12385 [Chloroflexi bacterium]|nr:hypothetical protein [Chloroflexota bacterium]
MTRYNDRPGRGRWVWLLLTAVIPLLMFISIWPQRAVWAAPGDPVPGITCTPSYNATIYAEGLSSPDGLAFAPNGVLYAAEETAGQVVEVGATGVTTPVLTALTNPEGIAFDTAGNLYVVEDTQNGRLIQRTPGGVTTVLATGLDAPEGVVVAADNTVYLTESNIQFESNPSLWRSHVTAVSSGGMVTRLTTSAPVLNGFDVEFFSASGITIGPTGLVYAANELSGVETVQPPFTLTTTKSISAVNTVAGTSAIFSSGLTTPEGIRFSNIGFPLYAVEENTGRIMHVLADGSFVTLCAGFGSIEDVAVDGNRWLYISDDANGRIVRIDDGLTTAVSLRQFQANSRSLDWMVIVSLALAVAGIAAWMVGGHVSAQRQLVGQRVKPFRSFDFQDEIGAEGLRRGGGSGEGLPG